jgi:uncharacterized protein
MDPASKKIAKACYRLKRTVGRGVSERVHDRIMRRQSLQPAAMKPRISVLTVGVANLETSLRFYREGLGLPSEGIVGKEFEHGAVVFFRLHGGLMLALYPRKEIAWDATVDEGSPNPTEFTIGHNVNSRDEVDAVMSQARTAGARIVKSAAATFWGGYAGYFQDPDGHLWEVAWNPQLPVEE